MKNQAKFANEKSSQNHKKSQKSKYQGTARFSVRVLWFSVRTTLFKDFWYSYLNDFAVLIYETASGFTLFMLSHANFLCCKWPKIDK